MPVAWLIWQWVATIDSIQPAISQLTCLHFTFVVGWFFLGLLASRGPTGTMGIWLGIGLALVLVISSGFQQQFGGLEETRAFYEKLARGEQPPEIQEYFERPEIRRIWESPLFQLKVNSRRIYGTLFYPNTLAGVILLLIPGLLTSIWIGFRDASVVARCLLLALLGTGAGLCLVWSGSKAGWVIAFFQLGWILMQSSIPTRWRRSVLVLLAVLGVSGLVARNIDYFQRGARSLGARAEYWNAAYHAYLQHPVNGTGPGTFGEDYRTRKASESEMARLAHNDFIQQASDSGTVGFITYLAFVVGALGWSYRRLGFAVGRLGGMIWLGLLGWGLHSLFEFGLYVPAIAWSAFFLVGIGCREAANRIDTAELNL